MLNTKSNESSSKLTAYLPCEVTNALILEVDGQKNLVAADMQGTDQKKCLVLEPFCAGSHFQMIDLFRCSFDASSMDVLTLPGRKWPWRARTAALYFSQAIPENCNYHTIFCSSVLNLAELVALRSSLAAALKVFYFHENQLVYPVQRDDSCDFQFSYAQIVSCIVADRVVFNSKFNRDSFLSAIPSILRRIPKEGRPGNVVDLIELKCRILYFPVVFPPLVTLSRPPSELHIVWPHRWEHDKDPELFFSILCDLVTDQCHFRLSVLGETFGETPGCFQAARDYLKDRILHWGFIPSKEAYYDILRSSHVVVSTARHEFFGVAMYGRALSRTVGDFLSEAIYRTPTQLRKKLKFFCKHPLAAVEKRAKLSVDFSRYSWPKLKKSYADLLGLSLGNES